jgi:transcription termination/antitermination protein NusG
VTGTAELLPKGPSLLRPEVGTLTDTEPANGKHWYAAYTRFRYEKLVAEMLNYRGVEHYLPLYEAVHRWKDRNARVQLPLFPSYVFVHLALQDRMLALTIPGVIWLVGHPQPVPLPNDEIEALRNYLSHRLPVEPYPYLTQGKRVRIKAGPLAGLEGFVLQRKSTYRVVINLDLIHRSVVVDIAVFDLEPAHPQPLHLRAA